MKIIANKKTTIVDDNGAKDPANYLDLIKACINTRSMEGMDLEAMRKKLKVLNILEASKDKEQIELEDADYNTIVEAVKSMKWAIAHEDILAFGDYIADVRKEEDGTN